ncbi:MAG TPA: hypothetical protein ENK88_00295 [Campylobacterales bacterium]|nr:hypothetical protein [Campylobacterales bacterium]
MKSTIYTKKEILNSGINQKSKSQIFTLFFKINSFRFGVQYQPRYFNISMSLSHFSFYAMSRGFEEFTEIGFRSLFVQNSKKIASYREIEEYFIEVLKDKVALEDKNLKPIQLALF